MEPAAAASATPRVPDTSARCRWASAGVGGAPAIRFVYRYGVALGADFVRDSPICAGCGGGSSGGVAADSGAKVDLTGALVLHVSADGVPPFFFFSFGQSGVVVDDLEPVQVKWSAPKAQRREAIRLARFMRAVDLSGSLHMCAAWYYIDATRADVRVIQAPTPAQIKRLDAAIRKEVGEQRMEQVYAAMLFEKLGRKEESSSDKKKAPPQQQQQQPPASTPQTVLRRGPDPPKVSRMAALRKEHAQYVAKVQMDVAAVGGPSFQAQQQQQQQQQQQRPRKRTAPDFPTPEKKKKRRRGCSSRSAATAAVAEGAEEAGLESDACASEEALVDEDAGDDDNGADDDDDAAPRASGGAADAGDGWRDLAVDGLVSSADEDDPVANASKKKCEQPRPRDNHGHHSHHHHQHHHRCEEKAATVAQ